MKALEGEEIENYSHQPYTIKGAEVKTAPFIFMSFIFYASFNSPLYSDDSSKTRIPIIAINLSPHHVVSISLVGSVEYLFAKKHGAGFRGWYRFNKDLKGYSGEIRYRYHFHKNPKHHGLSSLYIGPFFYFERSENEVVFKGVDYKVDYKSLRIGPHVGRRWLWGKTFNLDACAGYGIPIVTNYDYSPKTRPDGADGEESKATIIYGFLAEISIGFAF